MRCSTSHCGRRPALDARPRTCSLDELIGPRQKRWWDRDAKGLRSIDVDDQLELRWLLDREIGRLCPTQNLVDIFSDASEQVRKVCSVAHQASRIDVLPKTMHRR